MLTLVAVLVAVFSGSACVMHVLAGFRWVGTYPRGARYLWAWALGYGVACWAALAYFGAQVDG